MKGFGCQYNLTSVIDEPIRSLKQFPGWDISRQRNTHLEAIDTLSCLKKQEGI